MIYGNYLRDKYNNTAVKLADAEGVPCVMEYSKGKNLRNYEIYGNSVQDGTPSPENPVEVQSVGNLVTDTASEYYGKYDVPITIAGTSSETKHIYLNEPLRKVGDYADYIDFKNQKVVRKVKELELNENINFITYEITATGHKGFRFYRSDMLSGIRDYGYCTHIENIPFYELSNIWFGVNNPIIYMSFPDIYNQGETDDERKAAFYTFLSAQAKSGTPVKVIYILATPTEEPISLPALKTFKGTSIMSVNTSIQPSNIKTKYVRL